MGAHLPLQGLEPVGGEPLMSVTRGQCDVRPTVTFPAKRHHCPLAGIVAKDDESGDDNWSHKTCKAPIKSSPPANQHPAFYRLDADEGK